MRRFAVVLPLLGLAAALLSGCATPPPPGTSQEDQAEYAERNDPYEPANRKFFAVNEFLDRNALHPVASAYRDTVPGTVRTHVHNVLSNLGNPAQLTNDVLQGRPRKAGNTFMRIVINTTAGAAGIFDVASGLGFPDHDTDFGLTLALWGRAERAVPVPTGARPQRPAGRPRLRHQHHARPAHLAQLRRQQRAGDEPLRGQRRGRPRPAADRKPTRSTRRRSTPTPPTAAYTSNTGKAPWKTHTRTSRRRCRTGIRPRPQASRPPRPTRSHP